jgi:hypothetical protein
MQDVEVSGDCLDMLTRVLVAAPAKRMSMEQIKEHRWFLKGLPPGALEMNDFLLQGLAGQEEVRLARRACALPLHNLASLFQDAFWCSYCRPRSPYRGCTRLLGTPERGVDRPLLTLGISASRAYRGCGSSADCCIQEQLIGLTGLLPAR